MMRGKKVAYSIMPVKQVSAIGFKVTADLTFISIKCLLFKQYFLSLYIFSLRNLVSLVNDLLYESASVLHLKLALLTIQPLCSSGKNW